MYLIACFFMTAYPSEQIMVVLYAYIPAMIYAGQHNPWLMKKWNRLELVNEWFLFAITLHMQLYTDFVPDPETRYQIGWSMISYHYRLHHQSLLHHPEDQRFIYFALEKIRPWHQSIP
jgi:hypothetical protein